jgi:hypothetical protein
MNPAKAGGDPWLRIRAAFRFLSTFRPEHDAMRLNRHVRACRGHPRHRYVCRTKSSWWERRPGLHAVPETSAGGTLCVLTGGAVLSVLTALALVAFTRAVPGA